MQAPKKKTMAAFSKRLNLSKQANIKNKNKTFPRKYEWCRKWMIIELPDCLSAVATTGGIPELGPAPAPYKIVNNIR